MDDTTQIIREGNRPATDARIVVVSEQTADWLCREYWTAVHLLDNWFGQE